MTEPAVCTLNKDSIKLVAFFSAICVNGDIHQVLQFHLLYLECAHIRMKRRKCSILNGMEGNFKFFFCNAGESDLWIIRGLEGYFEDFV